MCVTNISKRRNVATPKSGSATVSSRPSLISERLMGNFIPFVMNNNATYAKPSTGSTCTNSVDFVPNTAAPAAQSMNSFYCQQQSYYSQQQQPQPQLIHNLVEEKKKPKRRRKPQKPGKTAKQNERHFVVHNYHDHASDPDEHDEEVEEEPRRRGGVSISFPQKLHASLDRIVADGWGHVISWQPHGRCFLIHKPKEFQEHVMPLYFSQNKLTSFQRQLNLYGFCRLTRGPDAGAYYHELFLRGRFFLAKKMQRTKIKGTKFKAASNPDHEPDFYRMAPVQPLGAPAVSDDSSFDSGTVASHQTQMNTGYMLNVPNMSNTQAAFSQEAPTALIEPIPVQIPPRETMSAMSALEPFPFFEQSATPMAASNGVGSSGYSFNNMSSFTGRSDLALDRAVNDLFTDVRGDNNNLAQLDNTSSNNFDDIWDTTDLGQEARQDDIQLGFMLENLLQE